MVQNCQQGGMGSEAGSLSADPLSCDSRSSWVTLMFRWDPKENTVN